MGWTLRLLAMSEILHQLVCFIPSMAAVLWSVSGGIGPCQTLIKSVSQGPENSALLSNMAFSPTSSNLSNIITSYPSIDDSGLKHK